MLSLRAFARSAPRSAQRWSAHSLRYTHTLPRSTFVRQSSRMSLPVSSLGRAAFSTAARRMQETQVSEELAAKLESELSMEKEMRDPDAFPPLLREYLENSPFQVQDTPGKEEVVLTRTYNDENIRVAFSIDDLNNVDQDADELQDEASMMDDLDDQMSDPGDDLPARSNQKRSINQSGPGNRGFDVAPEDSIAPADTEEMSGDGKDPAEVEQEPSFPAHVHVTVERPNRGAIQIEAIAQDGLMVIDNVYYYREAKLADPTSIENQIATRDLYTGPPFGNLDEDLQLLFERYLDERGINTALALFIPEYIDYKEQREYLSWLSGVKSFVE